MRRRMRVDFIKMHGLGNDFVVLDARARQLPDIDQATASAIADRRTGIGCDQLILLTASEAADFRMRIFNNDGSEVGACGNASRAVALLHGAPARVETDGGLIAVEPSGSGASVDMGEPRFDWDAIPLAYAMDTAALPVGWDGLDQAPGLLVDQVFEPLAAGRAAAYRRWDWEAHAWAESHPVPAAEVLIVEGVGLAAAPYLGALVVAVGILLTRLSGRLDRSTATGSHTVPAE